MPLRLLLSFLLVAIISACGSRNKEPGIIESLSKVKEYAENIEEKTKNATSRWEERKAKGDTIAIPYKDLQAYLPAIGGYEMPEGPKGSQMNTPGLGNWSQTEQQYTSGEKRVGVSIMDYNGAEQTFMGLTAMYGMGMSMEDDDKKMGPADLGIKGVSAYETIYKKDKRAELSLVVGDRFIINMSSNGDNDPGFLSGIAKDMDLGKLAEK